MSQNSIPECLDDADYLLTYELGANSWRTLLFASACELRRFLAERGLDKEPTGFFIRKQCLMDNDAFLSGDDNALEGYVRITNDGNH